MGLFNRFTSNKPASTPPTPMAQPEAAPEKKIPAGAVMPLLAEAREKLAAKDLPAALAIYEQVLTVAADRWKSVV